MNADEITAAYTAFGRALAAQEAFALRARRRGTRDERWSVVLDLDAATFATRAEAEAAAAALARQVYPLLNDAINAAEEEGLLAPI